MVNYPQNGFYMDFIFENSAVENEFLVSHNSNRLRLVKICVCLTPGAIEVCAAACLQRRR